ncbi:hypothetical protein TD95_001571 [Thielaviopsis punctulata]|uniref:glucan 1,3-beta-glucosidase n=1 Tax=Thielaviopsis punctulata TaxID=72032 RepID=A0A0F4ZFY9_9PEZI|nr:hypothetical protein TD95_001571 [Thielaviopsis punctulata]
MDSQAHILPREKGPAKAVSSAAALQRKREFIIVGTGVLIALIFLATVIGSLAADGTLRDSTHSADADTNTAPDTLTHTHTNSTPTATPAPAIVNSTSASNNGTVFFKSDCARISNIPADVKGTFMDMTTWIDSANFNCTWTNVTVGNLSIAGLNSTWDDSVRANPFVPPLNTSWGSYTARPVRGVNLGGWLSLEPFITPSLFDYPASAGIVDEYTLSKYLGANASSVLEAHYASFITEADFAAIAAAGLDHVRIPYSYWAVTTYPGDPYVRGVSWRYLLIGIEWARKYGLRVNLDLHAVPGSQNGWNHSGRVGNVTWILGGATGALNRERTLQIHKQLATFFAQPRYANIVDFYGQVNEPSASIPTAALEQWTKDAYAVIRDAGFTGLQTFSDGLRGVQAWDGMFNGYNDTLVIDTHLYAIFAKSLLTLTRPQKISYACSDWADASTADLADFGPTLVGEWSVADNDCTWALNGVNGGSRWDGTYAGTDGASWCPTQNASCTCAVVDRGVDAFVPEYKAFLSTWASAQMDAFERTWGWFYWTWKTENAPLFSYKAGMEAGFLPQVAYNRSWSCSNSTPSFGGLAEYE